MDVEGVFIRLDVLEEMMRAGLAKENVTHVVNRMLAEGKITEEGAVGLHSLLTRFADTHPPTNPGATPTMGQAEPMKFWIYGGEPEPPPALN